MNQGLTVGSITFGPEHSTTHDSASHVIEVVNAKQLTIKEMVAGDKQVYFIYYKDKNLWYKTEEGFEFPVPIEDVGTATFLAQDRAMMFMRYIRKHLTTIDEARQAVKH